MKKIDIQIHAVSILKQQKHQNQPVNHSQAHQENITLTHYMSVCNKNIH